MKTGKTFTTLVMAVIAAAVAVYFGVYAFNTFNDPYTTTFAYAYTVNDSRTLSGILVRDELPLSPQSGILDLTLSESERVGSGQTVALVYQDSQAQADQGHLEQLAREMALLESAVQDAGSVESAARLDEEILQSVVELRAASALDDFSRLEDQVLAVKSSVLKRGYTYGDGVTADALSARLRQLRQEYTQLNQKTASAVKKVAAPQSGTFSSLVDGYETILTPETVFNLTPSGLSTLLENRYQGGDAVPGKLILGFRWYYAANLPEETAGRLREGTSARLRFSGEFSQDVEMTVEQLGPSEGGQTLAVFSSDRFLSQTTLLRLQQAELIFEDFTGLRIPKAALRMEKEYAEDQSGSQIVTGSRLGVYALVSGRVEFKGAEVITEGSDYYVVRPTDTGRKLLRAGDEIIVEGTGLYAGQLLEY